MPGTGQFPNSTCIRTNQKEFVDNVVIQEPLGSSDHNQLYFNINIKSVKTKVKQRRRDFRKGNYKEIRKSLALIDWNDMMKNKTATECWTILRGEVDIAIDSYVPMKKQGKRSKKKVQETSFKRCFQTTRLVRSKTCDRMYQPMYLWSENNFSFMHRCTEITCDRLGWTILHVSVLF